MKVTKEMIESGIFGESEGHYLLHTFEDGVDIEREVEGDAYVPDSVYMWVLHHLELTEEVREKVKEKLKIKDTHAFYNVRDVKNCTRVSNSMYCEDSQRVEGSRDVVGSRNVKSGRDIVNSESVVKSDRIEESKFVIASTDVRNGQFIYASTEVANSLSIHRGEMIEDSAHLLECRNTKHSLLSRNLENAQNKILCEGISNCDTPMIFNEEVSARIFDRVYLEVRSVLEEELNRSMLRRYFAKTYDDPTCMTPSLLLFSDPLSSPSLWMRLRGILPTYNPSLAYKLSNVPTSL